MIITTYQCDRCGTKEAKPDQMWRVGVLCYHVDSQPGPLYTFPAQLWCRPCADLYQLISPPKVVPDNVTPVVTLEDKLREIVREIVQED